jgi:hypothetical protein
MSRSCLLSLTLVCLLICQPLDAKPGKGGGPKRGSGPKKSISRGGGGGRSFSPQQKSVGGRNPVQSPSGKGKPEFTTKGKPDFGTTKRGNGQSVEKLTGRDRAVSVQRGNEDRKLLHRQNTAQKLRDISERNGNENLKDVAGRMDQKALDHYDKRQAKIDELKQRGTDTPFDENELRDPFDRPLTDQQIANLDNPTLQQQHRLLNEERKLQHQLDVAQKLRDLSARNGNPNLLNTAERMELMAADRYASQLQKILGPTDVPLSDPLTAPQP